MGDNWCVFRLQLTPKRQFIAELLQTRVQRAMQPSGRIELVDRLEQSAGSFEEVLLRRRQPQIAATQPLLMRRLGKFGQERLATSKIV